MARAPAGRAPRALRLLRGQPRQRAGGCELAAGGAERAGGVQHAKQRSSRGARCGAASCPSPQVRRKAQRGRELRAELSSPPLPSSPITPLSPTFPTPSDWLPHTCDR